MDATTPRLPGGFESQFAALQPGLEVLGFPAALFDGTRRYRYVNPAYSRYFGLPPEAFYGRDPDEIFKVRPNDTRRERMARAFGGEHVSFNRQTIEGPNTGHWVRSYYVPLESANEVVGVLVVLFDVQPQKDVEDRLAREEARTRFILEHVPGSVAVFDPDLNCLYANRLFKALRGIPDIDISGLHVAEVVGERDMARFIEPNIAAVRRGETRSYEHLASLPDQGPRWQLVHLVPILDPEGEFAGCYSLGTDIHDLKLAEERLRQAHERIAAHEEELRFFAENIPEAIVYIDVDRGCTFVNNIFLQTRGMTREDALGRFPREVFPRDKFAAIEPHLERVLRGESSSYERQLRTLEGGPRWIRVSLTPRIDPQGRVLGYYVVSTDIHDIKLAQAQIEDKERQLRAVIDSIPTPMAYVDADARYRYVNDSFLGYVGRRPEDIVGRSVREVLGEERWSLLAPVLDRVRAGESLAVERLIQFADGRARWMNVRLTPRVVDGEYLGYYATTSDIHDQKMVEQELRRTNSILSAHFDNTPLAVLEYDMQLRVCRWSGQAQAIFGWTPAEALGRPFDTWRLVYEDDSAAYEAMIAGLLEGRERHATITVRNYRKDGSVIWVEWHNSALRDDSGRVISILSLAQDVSTRIQAEERLQFMATHDGLTGLPNSVLLNSRLEAALARARRARCSVGVMFLDLDRFKDVNDTHGHRVGDLLLKELARRLRAGLRQSDLLARVSGDEFVVLLEDLDEDGATDHVARKILAEVRRPFLLEGHEIHVSASLGLALFPDDGQDNETLLKNADAAMYHAKDLGRDGYRMFSEELARKRAQRVQVETALRRALKSDELSLHYQPIMDIGTREIRRVEALLRWQDPERGLVMPHAFIPLAEETGLGNAVGQWVLDAACRQARDWRDRGVGDIAVCVNLSASQLRDASMINDLRAILAANGCEPSWLQLEITETSMVRDVESASALLARFRALGVRIAIDDFGTGYSSLSHLRHLPVDVLKVDKSFTADVDDPTRAASERASGAAIVSAVIGLAKGLGLDVVAEGVERESQLEFLKAAGCRAAQGFLICTPLPAAEFERWLAGHRKPKRRRAKVTD